MDSRRDAPTPLPRMLLDLHREGFQGWLALHRGADTRRIEWRAGAPVRLVSSLPGEAPGARLVAEGLLREADRERARREAARRGSEELAALAGLRLVAPADLLKALRAQLRELLVAACGWPDLSVEVEPAAAPGSSLPVPPLDPVAVVLEGVAAHWSAAAVATALGSRLDAHLALAAPQPGEGAAPGARLALGDAGRPLFAVLDGRRTGRALLEQLDDPRIRAGLFVLAALGRLEARDAPAPSAELEAGSGDDTASAPEIEVVIRGAAEAAPAADGASGAPAPPDEAAQQALDPAAAALRDEILELHGRLDELDAYTLLGVARDAPAAKIKKAYLKAAKRLHPDRLGRLGLDAVKAEANEVFARITQAHTVLSDPEQRRRYDEGGGEASDAEAQRLAQAESHFLQAEVLMRAGNFLGAVEPLERAVQLWPDEAAYQAALAWTLFKKNPPEIERSLELFGKALALDDRDAVAWLRLAIVRKQAGDADGAREARERGRRLDPDARP